MTNVEMLKKMGKLGAVRQGIGTDDEFDDSLDNAINRLHPQTVVEKYAGWHLGDDGWARDFIEMYLELMNKGK